MIFEARDELVKAIKEAAHSLWKIDVKPELTIPDNLQFGDLSSNLPFQLARELRRPPKEIASEIAGRIELPAAFSTVRPEGAGFLNFYYSDVFLREVLAQVAAEPRILGRIGSHKGKYQIEYVSANPTGPLNVVSARAAAVGSSLVNILRFAGYDVRSEYYLNDAGNQIKELTVSFILRVLELKGFSIEFGMDGYRGDYLADEAVFFTDTEPEKTGQLFKLLSDNLGGTITSEWVTGFFTITGNEEKKRLFSALREWIVDRMIAGIRETLEAFGTNIDEYYRETRLRAGKKVDETLELLRKKGGTIIQDGAEWFDTSKVDPNEQAFVLVKSDGEWTYGAVDIAYHRDKIARGFDHIYDIWGPDHHGHIGRMKAAMKTLGFCGVFDVLTLQQVNLLEGGEKVKMSKRSGNIVTLAELLADVGADVARFFFTARRMEAHLDFDLDLARKETDENPVFYIQYAHARICGILEHARISGRDVRSAGKRDFAMLVHPEEMALARKIAQLPYVLSKCALEMSAHYLCFYLLELAQTFHPFYAKHRIVGPDEELTTARLALCHSIKQTLSLGLDMLGISSPENM